MRVNIEDVLEVMNKWREYNGLDLNEVELYENGLPLEVPQKFKDDWKYTCLGLIGFIETDCYKYGFTERPLDEPQ